MQQQHLVLCSQCLLLFALFFQLVCSSSSGSGSGGPSSAGSSLPHVSFLTSAYKCSESGEKFIVRQVPGDGGCLFHSLTVCLDYEYTHQHRDFDGSLRKVSEKLRRLAVKLLTGENDTLVMDNGEEISSSNLLQIVSDHYNMTTNEYCAKMLQTHAWGGGPEIVAISNHLKRPIHVYELASGSSSSTSSSSSSSGSSSNDKSSGSSSSSISSSSSSSISSISTTSKEFYLKVCAKFGSPTFDNHEKPLCILCADGRFPNIKPGAQKKAGDHFLALFPLTAAALAPSQASSSSSSSSGGGGVFGRATGLPNLRWADKLLVTKDKDAHLFTLASTSAAAAASIKTSSTNFFKRIRGRGSKENSTSSPMLGMRKKDTAKEQRRKKAALTGGGKKASRS